MNLSILLNKVFSIFSSFYQLIRKGKTSQISAETVTASRKKDRKTAYLFIHGLRASILWQRHKIIITACRHTCRHEAKR